MKEDTALPFFNILQEIPAVRILSNPVVYLLYRFILFPAFLIATVYAAVHPPADRRIDILQFPILRTGKAVFSMLRMLTPLIFYADQVLPSAVPLP